MPSLNERELDKILKQHGCVKVGDKGKHEKWKRPDGKVFPVPRTLKGEGTLQDILKFIGAK
jgi:predicted RNA binding protein YcfA (HicA-like mRNA interferase family)